MQKTQRDYYEIAAELAGTPIALVENTGRYDCAFRTALSMINLADTTLRIKLTRLFLTAVLKNGGLYTAAELSVVQTLPGAPRLDVLLLIPFFTESAAVILYDEDRTLVRSLYETKGRSLNAIRTFYESPDPASTPSNAWPIFVDMRPDQKINHVIIIGLVDDEDFKPNNLILEGANLFLQTSVEIAETKMPRPAAEVLKLIKARIDD